MLPPYWGIPKLPIALSWVPFMLSGEVTDKLFFSTTNRASEQKGEERRSHGRRRKERRWCFCFIVEISASTQKGLRKKWASRLNWRVEGWNQCFYLNSIVERFTVEEVLQSARVARETPKKIKLGFFSSFFSTFLVRVEKTLDDSESKRLETDGSITLN